MEIQLQEPDEFSLEQQQHALIPAAWLPYTPPPAPGDDDDHDDNDDDMDDDDSDLVTITIGPLATTTCRALHTEAIQQMLIHEFARPRQAPCVAFASVTTGPQHLVPAIELSQQSYEQLQPYLPNWRTNDHKLTALDVRRLGLDLDLANSNAAPLLQALLDQAHCPRRRRQWRRRRQGRRATDTKLRILLLKVSYSKLLRPSQQRVYNEIQAWTLVYVTIDLVTNRFQLIDLLTVTRAEATQRAIGDVRTWLGRPFDVLLHEEFPYVNEWLECTWMPWSDVMLNLAIPIFHVRRGNDKLGQYAPLVDCLDAPHISGSIEAICSTCNALGFLGRLAHPPGGAPPFQLVYYRRKSEPLKRTNRIYSHKCGAQTHLDYAPHVVECRPFRGIYGRRNGFPKCINQPCGD